MVARIRDQLARDDDTAAKVRDRAAEIRDDDAVRREQRTYADALQRGLSIARHPAAREREAADSQRTDSGRDRSRARHDREAAHKDRDRASDDRDAATAAISGHDKEYARLESYADDMLLVGQAQGVLMQMQRLSAADALLEIFTRASDGNTGLSVAAQHIISDVIDNKLDRVSEK